MSADDAFDKLMNKNALPIPMAKPNGEAARGPIGAAANGTPEDALRVDALFDDNPADDYVPPGPNSEPGEKQMDTHPTETDLEPEGGIGDLDSARLHGARVLGRDAMTEPGADDADGTDDDDSGYREAAVYDGGLDDGALDAGLGLARRIRRFAYLPLAGMERFENDARDMMALLGSQNPDRSSLLVTSARRGEGRTELAIRLALAMAKRVDSRVLLADFDLGHPQVASRLGVSSKHFSLRDALRGSCPVGEALVASEEDNLYVLPARPLDREGDEILDSRQARALFGKLHSIFDFIVVDAGPASGADVMILCRIVGATAVAGYCGTTAAADMLRTGEKLASAGARTAGFLLTGA